MTPRYAGVDPSTATGSTILSNIQAGILKGHGRELSTFLFARAASKHTQTFPAELKKLLPTTAIEQYHAARRYKTHLAGADPFTAFYVSASGYKSLHINRRYWPRDIAFRNGMKQASGSSLNDPPVEAWDSYFQNNIDLMVVIAADDAITLKAETGKIVVVIEKAFGGSVDFLRMDCQTIRNPNGWATDIFGFVDGISQPLFLKYDIDDFFIANPTSAWDPSIDPFNLLLVDDSMFSGSYGSYFVLRKLRQNRQTFNAVIDTLAKALGVPKESAEAQIIGRFKDGTPLVSSSTAVNPTSKLDGFDYSQDQQALRCPYHSHVRKANIRSNDPTILYSQIARRGVPYSITLNDGTKDEGLMFNCCQQDIARQFETQQSQWLNNSQFPINVPAPGVDAAAGLMANQPTTNTWNTTWGNPGLRKALLTESFISLAGGEYFYCPPPQFFKSIAEFRS